MRNKIYNKRSEFTLTVNQVNTLVNGITDFRDRCMVKCMYYGGMRVSEVVKMRVEHIDFMAERIVIHESKFGKTRVIPILDMSLASDLKILIDKRKSGEVFLSKFGRSMTTRAAQYIVKMWGQRLEVKNPNPNMVNLNPHIFRHSIARHLKSAKYSAEFIQRFLGHASIKTTMDEYGTLSLEEMQQIIWSRQGRTPIQHKNVDLLDDHSSFNV